MEVLLLLIKSAYFVYGVFLWISNPFGCETQVEREIKSPDARTSAIVFQIDCGATTPFNTQVSIVPSSADRFSADRYPPVLVLRDKHDLEIEWITEDAIEIKVPVGVRVYKKVGEADGVRVIYE